jgi:nitrogen fixation NifU-like protein
MNESDFDDIVKEIAEKIEEDEKKNYSERVLKEAREPYNFGRIESSDSRISLTGPCGDSIEFSMTVEDGRIKDIRFMTDGCGSSTACGSMTTRMSEGKSLEEAYGLDEQGLLDQLGGLPDENRHCAKLAVDTLHKAIEKYWGKER